MTVNMARSTGRPAKLRLVAHSTRPATRSAWRFHVELGDGTAHRVADRHEPIDAEHVGERHDVVGAVLEPEALAGLDAATVTSVVDADDAVGPSELAVRGEPVEGAGGRPAVQQDERRSVGGRVVRRGELVDPGRAPVGQLHGASRAGASTARPVRRQPRRRRAVRADRRRRPRRRPARASTVARGSRGGGRDDRSGAWLPGPRSLRSSPHLHVSIFDLDDLDLERAARRLVLDDVADLGSEERLAERGAGRDHVDVS